MLWLQGWDTAPAVPWSCREQWRKLNPDWTVRDIDLADLPDLIPGRLPVLPPAALSDLVRIELLRNHGGVWVDSTVFPMKPLDQWLPDYLASGFFAFDRPGPGRKVASWLLAGGPGNPIVERWADATRVYWAQRTEVTDYYWFHGLFEETITTHSDAADVWARTPRISARGPHYFAPYGGRFQRKMSRNAAARLAAAHEPVFKLSNRPVPDMVQSGSAWEWFVAGRGWDLPRPSKGRLLLDRVSGVAHRATADVVEAAYLAGRAIRR